MGNTFSGFRDSFLAVALMGAIRVLLLSILFITATVAGVRAEIGVNISFSPATVNPNQISRVTLRLTNSSLVPTGNAALTVALQDGVMLAPVPNVFNSCSGTVATPNGPDNGNIALSVGTIPPGNGVTSGACLIQADVIAVRKGTFVTEIPVGALTGVTGATSEANTQISRATLAAKMDDLTLSMSSDLQVLQGYETTLRRITIHNPNVGTASEVALAVDTSTWYNTRIVNDGSKGSTCGGSPVVDLSAAPNVAVSGATVPGLGSCEVYFRIEPSRDPLAPYLYDPRNHTIPPLVLTSAEGATNATGATYQQTTVTGVEIAKYANGTNGQFDTANPANNRGTFLLLITSYNTQAVSGINLTDFLPAGLTLVSTAPSNCTAGSSLNVAGTAGATQLDLSGTLAAVPAGVDGAQAVSCSFSFVVQPAAVGSYTNVIPAGTVNGQNQINATSASLSWTDVPVAPPSLQISKAIDAMGTINGTAYAGDKLDLRFEIRNNSTTTPISNLRILDDLATMGDGFRRDPSRSLQLQGQCGTGASIGQPGATSIQISGLTIPASGFCTVIVGLLSASDVVTSGTSVIRTNTVPVGNILFDMPGAPDSVFPSPVARTFTILAPVTLTKSYTPALVAPNGVSRLRVTVRRLSNQHGTMQAISLRDDLPSDHEIAATPAAVSTCGGVVDATPGNAYFTLAGGALASDTVAGSTQTTCYVEVNVKAPSTPGIAQNTIPGDVWGQPRVYFSATDSRHPSPYNTIYNLVPVSATLERETKNVTVNKEFIPANIDGGGRSRVRIYIINNELGAITLNNVSLTDDFAGTGLELYSDVSPAFTNTAGVANAGGCTGGSFSGSPGDQQITLSNATIAPGATCHFEFNATSGLGGNQVNTVPAGAILSTEGVTNAVGASATLEVEYAMNVSKGFQPPAMGANGESLLTIDIFNVNDGAVDQAGDSPALIDEMPAGVSIIPGTVATTCVGGVASSSVVGGLHVLRLDGGTFFANGKCTLTARVTSSQPGDHVNTIPARALNTLTGTTNEDVATATLTVVNPPTIAKSFNAATVGLEASSLMTLTVRNPNNQPLTGISFSDTLVNMQVAASPIFGSTCSGIVHNVVGDADYLEFSGISLLPNSQCTISMNVESSVPGVHPNTTTGATYDQGVDPGPPSNTANLTVLRPLTVSKSFSVPETVPGQPVTVSLTITNPDTISAVTLNGGPIGGLRDILPSSPGQMRIAPVPNLTSSCIGTRIGSAPNSAVVSPGATVLHMSGGTWAPGAVCVITFDVVATVLGDYVNTTTQIQSNGGYSPAASAPLKVIAPVPALTVLKSALFNDANTDGVAQAGETVTYTYTVENTGTVGLTGVTVAETAAGFSGTGTLPVPAWVSNSGISGQGALAPGEVATFTALYTLTQADVDAGEVVNQASATGTPAGGGTPVTDLSHPTDPAADGPTLITYPTGTPAIEFIIAVGSTRDVNGDGIIGAGDQIIYRFEVVNTGTVVLTGVNIDLSTLSLDLPGLTCQPVTLAPGERAFLICTGTAYTITAADVTAGEVVLTGDASGTSPVGVVVRDSSTAPAVTAEPVPAGELTLEKLAGVETAMIGDLVPYTIRITNSAAGVPVTVRLVDTLPAGFHYRAGSSQLDGVAIDPTESGRRIELYPVTVAPGQVRVWTVQVLVGSTVRPGAYTNRAVILSPVTGTPLAPESTAVVRVLADAVLQCATVLGRVFDDADQNGDMSKHTDERGLPNVRLVAPNGLSITTDEHGRFNVPCAAMPRAIGSNFMLKLDERTLPAGYRMTTENPRVVRLTPGMITRMDFGATMARLVRVDLAANAFGQDASGRDAMTGALDQGLRKLVAEIRDTTAMLRITYVLAPGEAEELAKQRLRMVERALRKLWSREGKYKLNIETLVQRAGAPQ